MSIDCSLWRGMKRSENKAKNGAPPLTKGCTDVEHQFGAGEGIR